MKIPPPAYFLRSLRRRGAARRLFIRNRIEIRWLFE